MIAVINSVILGVLAGIIINLFSATSLLLPAVIGLIFFAVSVVLHMRAVYSVFTLADKKAPILFGADPAEQEQAPPATEK